MSEPNWVLLETAIAIHGRQISEHGGLPGIRDLSLLESAMVAPRNVFHYQIPKPRYAELAASYSYSLLSNHPFFDGNKRVALVVCELFLQLNDLRWQAPSLQKYDCMMSLAKGELAQANFAMAIENHLSVVQITTVAPSIQEST